MSEGTETWVGLEAEAAAIRSYELQLVPGLLQTPEYAETVLRVYFRTESPRQIERRVELRMARQQLVIEQNNTPIWTVLDEAVLRRQIGPRSLMQSQYKKLIDSCDGKNVTVQVLPLASGVYSGVPGAFTIMQLPHPDPEVVVIEHRGGTYTLNAPTTCECTITYSIASEPARPDLMNRSTTLHA
jgi:hypothetical protein